jgi:CPA1 family monovalent cation:H+ antiporter
MSGLALVVVVGAAILVCTSLARRLRTAPPALLLVAGLLLGFVPALRREQLPPQAVLLVFLPVLLYWESFTSSVREIRANLPVIVLMSTVLIALTRRASPPRPTASGCPGGRPGCSAPRWHRPTRPRSACSARSCPAASRPRCGPRA